jgi:hypothetical protein
MKYKPERKGKFVMFCPVIKSDETGQFDTRIHSPR